MNTMQLSCFVEVAGTLSFSKAANNLHVSQPTVSHQVKSLEDELGVALLARSTRTVRLTEEGHAFLGYAYDLLDLMSRARSHLRHDDRDDAHRLGIGVRSGLEAQLMAPVLHVLHQQDPRLDPVVRMGPPSALADMVENGALDLALAWRNPAGESAGATSFRRLLEVPVACVCAPEHPLARAGRRAVTARDLEGAGRFAVSNPQFSPPALAKAQRAAGLTLREDRIMMCMNDEIALALAASGIACTLMPDVPAMHRAGLCFIPFEGTDPVTLGVRVRRGRTPRLVDRFAAVLAEKLQEEPAS